MRDASRNYLFVGVFVVAMLVALVVWLAALSGRTGPTDAYFVRYASVLTLNEGAEVLFEGYPIGVVRQIGPVQPDGGGGFRVELSVRRGWRIPEDSVASIATGSFLAANCINIEGGTSAEGLAPGSEIPSRERADVFGALASVANDFGVATRESLVPMIEDVSTRVPAILETLESFTERTLSPETSERLAQSARNLDRALANFARLSGELEQTRRQLDAVLASLDGMVDENRGDLRRAVDDLRYSLATAAEHADAISQNLESITRNMNEFSRQVRDNPGVLLRGRDVGATVEAAQ